MVGLSAPSPLIAFAAASPKTVVSAVLAAALAAVAASLPIDASTLTLVASAKIFDLSSIFSAAVNISCKV